MAEYEDKYDLDPEKVRSIAENTVESIIGFDELQYNREKVNQWCQQIIEGCLKELVKLDKKYKYVVTCIIQ